ncbi:MAG: 30S ribosomal protein S13 [Planctomycetota bacterium]|jgi:small subunit ribosomal protein S13|nr:30S ribosomal protein S13 [Planctomycetota bacterium]|tara:strand:+ start:604 stop:981 length:378 start_codon:yes stop_codon:yes gene_type:complete
MPRIVGVDVPNEKPIWIALTYVYGVGRAQSSRILEATGIEPMVRARDLTDDEVSRIASELSKNHVVEGQLRRQLRENIKRLKDIGCYRGFRHRKGLPVRGQRTKSNARTRKGPKKTVAGKKAVKH